MTEADVAILILSLEGLLFIALGFAMPGMAPSPLVGIRVRATRTDERVWRETHVYAGPRFMRLGVAVLVVGLALVLAPGPDIARLVALLVVSVGGIAWLLWDTTRYANERLRHWQRVDALEASRTPRG